MGEARLRRRSLGFSSPRTPFPANFRLADNPPRTPFFTSHSLCGSVTRRILDEHGGPTRAAKKLLCCSWVRDLVTVGEGRQERNKGIFLLVCELKVAELSFVEVG